MTKTTDPLGARIRDLRIARGWSQRELARAAGVNDMSVYHWERNECRLQYTSRQRVARAFGLTVRELEGKHSVAETPGLEPGWLARQFAQTEEEIQYWPGWMRREAAAQAQAKGREPPTYRQPPPEEYIPQLQAQLGHVQDRLAAREQDIADILSASGQRAEEGGNAQTIIAGIRHQRLTIERLLGEQHAPLVWQDQPSDEGWYWYVIATSRNRHGPTEVHRINGTLCAVTGDGEGWKPCTSFRRRWAGPLPVPEAPP